VRRVQGAVSIENVSVQLIEKVRGNVNFIGTVEFANSGTSHVNGLRTAYVPPASECSIREIEGNLTAWVGRMTLNLEGIAGTLDVRNEFGDTIVNAGNRLPETAHRILSQSGNIEVNFSSEPSKSLPIMALTNHGKIITNLPQNLFEDTNFTTQDAPTMSRRNWRGMISSPKTNQAGLDIWDRMQRPNLVWSGSARAPGLDLISRAGHVTVRAQNE
jgi:hypothetical protein